jgi:hypothetical protein
MVVSLTPDLYNYDQLLAIFHSLQNGGITIPPDAWSAFTAKVRKSAEALDVDLSPYEDYLV